MPLTNHPYKYNGVELNESLGLNLYEMDWRQYDPAIGRFTSIDPIAHHSQSTYTAFDNNPAYWTDPSGTTSVQDLVDNAISGVKYNSNDDGTFTGNGHTIGDKNPEEGSSRAATSYNSYFGEYENGKSEFYHAGGVNGSKAGWYSESEYANKIKPIALELAKSMGGWNMKYDGSIQALGKYDVYMAFMLSRNTVDGLAGLLIDYGNRLKETHNAELYAGSLGNIDTNDFSTIAVFFPALRGLGSTLTTADGFLLGSLSIRAPFNIPVQRFGNMSLTRPDFWGLRLGSNKFINRTFVAIKPKWNSLGQYTIGIIPKGSPMKFGIVGPQGLRYPGGAFQFILNSNNVVKQASKLTN